ncbi:4-hydroxybenzoate octaprenyltransferase [Alienimonas californiensis]|uniref:4-hydroxybenzoate polyprenyltransferase n=1 Tax=Alienimonas californiensis TaxID=2527989 RepID=A0A517P6A8_9PLAN|nr:4-hydroxybenzoate octaprenyltransferase [Alienimonas californiensis]QDT14929.1 4-hydroxybenzoate octaprenyltransferase [Alienimonas californiensis]
MTTAPPPPVLRPDAPPARRATVADWLGLIRFSHTVFALPFALMAALLAWRATDAGPTKIGWDLLGVTLCMATARAAAMAFNRLVDRRIDAANPRTASRHLPAGIVSPTSAALFTLICSVGFVASTLLFLPNRWPLYLSLPVLAWLLGYSLAKRWTWLCHWWLSAALALAPIAAWLAIAGDAFWQTGTPALWLAAVVLLWVGGFDILYSCQDADFDCEAGLNSVPARFGVPTALKIAAAGHLLCGLCLFGLWFSADLGGVFLAGVIGVCGLLIYEHALVKPHDLSRVGAAFFTVNAIISLGLLAVLGADLAATRFVG